MPLVRRGDVRTVCEGAAAAAHSEEEVSELSGGCGASAVGWGSALIVIEGASAGAAATAVGGAPSSSELMHMGCAVAMAGGSAGAGR